MHLGKADTPEDDQRAWRCLSCHLWLWIVLAAVLSADLISKHLIFARLGEPQPLWVVDGPPDGRSWDIIPGVLEFRTQYNEGAALGILIGYVPLFIMVGIVALAVFFIFFARSHRRQWFFQTGIALVLAGAVGNIYDRLVYKKVRDFIHVTARIKADLVGRWPRDGVYPYIFNVADMALVVGVIMIMVSSVHRARAGAGKKQIETQRNRGGREDRE